MDAAKPAELQAHVRAIAALLYAETTPEPVATLADIEESGVNQPSGLPQHPATDGASSDL